MQPKVFEAGRKKLADIALSGNAEASVAATSRTKILRRLRFSEMVFRHLTRAAAILVLIILSGVIIALIKGSLPALQAFGLDFLIEARWNPQHYLRHLGLVRVCPVPAAHAATSLDRLLRQRAVPWGVVRRAAVRDRHSYSESHSRHHGAAVHYFDFARRLRGGAACFEGSRLRRRLHNLGSGVACGASLCARWCHRRRHARSRPRARRDHGGDFRHRQCPQSFGIDPGARHHDLRYYRQRIHRSRGRPLYVVVDCAGADPVRDYLHCVGSRSFLADASRKADWVNMDRYGWRRLGNTIVITSSIGATVLGLGWLVLILGSLIYQGLNGLSLAVFTQMTPPPGADGGLLNPIMGSLMLTVLAIAIGTPIGILAGTYMAEYGKS